ncbi:MAG: MATE family efflux transporter [Coriobacteriales bacterium]|jgi:putative MATE family efflux protein|nr:MATE family efflux transporter [Coriobacteriales bacterium]
METTESPNQIQDNQQKVNRLGNAKIGKLLMEYAIPSIISMVANGLYNIVDAIFMGIGVGAVGQATATIAMPIMILSMSVSVLIGAGGNALAALRLGEGKRDEAEHVLGQAFFMVIVAAVLMTTLVNIFMDPVLSISGATSDTWESAHWFIRIASIGFILQFFGMGFNNFMRTAGDPNRALYTMLAGTGACILLNFLFVIMLHMGVAGSALATIIGQGFSAVLVFWYFVFSKKAPFKLHKRYVKPHLRLIRSILALGSAPFFLQIAASIINLVLNNQLAIYGAMQPIGAMGAQASVGVAARVIMLAFFPLMGVSMAAQPILGYNYGAQMFARVKTAFKYAIIWVIVIGIVFWGLIHLFPYQIATIFGMQQGPLMDYTTYVLQVQCFFMPLVGIQVISTSFFQSSGQPLKSMFLSLTRQVIYLIPLLLLLPWIEATFDPISFITPLDAINVSYPMADGLSLITAIIMMSIEFKKLNNRIKDARAKYAAEKKAAEEASAITEEASATADATGANSDAKTTEPAPVSDVAAAANAIADDTSAAVDKSAED